MTLLLIAAALCALGVLAILVVPRLVVRSDERNAGEPTGLSDPPPGATAHIVTTDDGAELHVQEWGHGPPIVLVHGLGLDHRTWQYQYGNLAHRFRLIGVDLRGHGRSTMGTDPFGPHRSADDLAAVFTQLDLHGAVLAGHSLGGTVVGQFCADHPDLVRERIAGLVFVGTFASSIAGEGRFRETFSPTLVRLTARFQTTTEPRGTASTSAWVYAMARQPFGPNPHPEAVRHTLTMGAQCAPSVMGAATLANLDYDVREHLRRLECPVLVIRGEHDSLATARSAGQFAAALPSAEMVVIERSGHLPMLETHEDFDGILIDFADRVTAEPPTGGARGQDQ
jgi:pimeloyl-ACP methyl ester carboxylesterase